MASKTGREQHNRVLPSLSIVCLLLLMNHGAAQENKTVVGPSNLPLYEGAQALLAGDANEGIRLTLIGLRQARDAKERETAKANLCAGYSLLEEYSIALTYCDEVLQENAGNWRTLSNRALIYVRLERYAEADADLKRGEAISPQANTLQAVRRIWLDATNPVTPVITIDDRRSSAGEFAPDDEG